jgi:DNA-directed RNA polymerase specialized sigma subunit
MRGSDDTEEIKSYLQQFAPTKRLIRFMNDALANCTSESEKRHIKHIVREKEKLVEEIYTVVFRLPDGIELTLINLRYLNDMTVEEVCSTMFISKSTFHTHHKKALQLLKEMRDKK